MHGQQNIKVFPIVLSILSQFAILLQGISWPIRLTYSVSQNPGACAWFRRYIFIPRLCFSTLLYKQ